MITCKTINQQNSTLAEREACYARLEKETREPRVLLQTCNRVEIYSGAGDVPNEVARHLFRVTAGLESALVGERAIQGQVREAYRTAQSHYRLPPEMHKLFAAALQTGKRVRNETEISCGAVSHSLAALEIIEGEGIDLARARIVIVGVNKLTSDILKFLRNKGARLVMLANRSTDKARALAAPLGIDVRSLSEKREWLAETDILISATSAPHAIFFVDDFQARPLLAIDLAFPRDIDPKIGEINGIKLYNLSDIEATVRRNISVRFGEVAKAEAIIEQAIDSLQATLLRRRNHLFMVDKMPRKWDYAAVVTRANFADR